MKSNIDKVKLALVDYFIKDERYTVYKYKPQGNNNAYLYKIDHEKFQIIKIVDVQSYTNNKDIKNDQTLDDLKKFINKKYQRAALTTFTIIITDNETHVHTHDNGDIDVYVTQDNYQNKVGSYYPNLASSHSIDVNKMSPEELAESIQDPNSPLNKGWKQFANKISAHNLVIPWIIVILLVSFPLIYVLFGPQFIDLNSDQVDIDVINLVFGGVTRDLLVFNNQWWRLFTYPFFTANLPKLFIETFLIYITAKYIEGVMGKLKFSFVLILGIPIVGLTLSSVLPNLVFSGTTMLLAMLWGTLFAYNYAKNDLGSFVASYKTMFAPIYLLLLPLFGFLGGGNLILYVPIFGSFFIGSAIGFLADYNIKKLDWGILYPLVVLFGSIITSIVLLNIRTTLPMYNPDVLESLQIYADAHLVRPDIVQYMREHYYHYYGQ